MESTTQTVNGLSGFWLNPGSPVDAGEMVSFASNPSLQIYAYLGIRVWKRDSAGNETEITTGTPVAVVGVPYGTTARQHYSATWNCPQTPLNPTDNIVIRVYGRFGPTGTWVALSNNVHLTERLNAQSLDASTWTVHYIASYFYYSPNYILEHAFGTSYIIDSTLYRSQIDNFTWTPPPVVKKPIVVGDGLAGAVVFVPEVAAPASAPSGWEGFEEEIV
jgi:hypothetical protein